MNIGDLPIPALERRIDSARGETLATAFSYDDAGRLTATDGPLPGSDDALYNLYDILGRRIWEIGPKGANGLRRAKRFEYRPADDKVVAVEEGTVADPANPVLTVLSRTD